ncbi:site-2 protease family protein [Mesorhizobium sp. M4B.F.Ca.ET.215.01.1.1]|uniref:site-2 protease family protein n=1 Tax=unclassified Mesorhizobium TaxID=325217 RepID=UPI000FCAE18D|nr:MULTISPECIES: site-2 protease family protein [unclassified Mesorhizobium]RVC56205.1 site-2 protease family protein [Mesorhizobium sp. M4B.F.Ca.ET.088.02.2.1]RUW22184.1 site-2 protease family protein [Mesorhizobium sp. M4B.F.Ca.ET.013.02.1.1]RVD42845.1 site-2 protease family protein [Mesorhizobium sp. M4B.F.Ca.ET.019.03.1.1]RWF28813.1 MAG: site-2 protease family protein [Mesorhizobium sp.]RWF44244.1 MAG: site-2 protease family protein [Mesorhizobium sp.]
MSPIVMAILLAGNLGLIFLLMTLPLGLRTVRVSRLVAADRHRLWQALWPFGSDAGWSGEIVSAEALDGQGVARIVLSWEGRDGQPIERKVVLEDVVEGGRFSMRVLDDSSLDASFWASYRETTELVAEGAATRVSLGQTDRYRGVAFLIFRYFAMRRELGKLQRWARTGEYRKGGWFEHPLSQVGFAVLSAFILWPFFGLSLGGLALAAILTSVVALHELGHMAAFRLMGHSRARMIFIPLLGGIAIGGRPYDSRFEVAFVALMGAGFSAFLVPVLIAASGLARGEGHGAVAALLATLAGFSALFNIANLVPVWKFDGGQVLRQICPGPIVLALASFLLLSALLALGWLAGFSPGFLLAAGVVFLILSLLTMGSAVKPRHELKPIRTFDRFAMAGALLAVFAIHGYGVLWASTLLV